MVGFVGVLVKNPDMVQKMSHGRGVSRPCNLRMKSEGHASEKKRTARVVTLSDISFPENL